MGFFFFEKTEYRLSASLNTARELMIFFFIKNNSHLKATASAGQSGNHNPMWLLRFKKCLVWIEMCCKYKIYSRFEELLWKKKNVDSLNNFIDFMLNW